MMDRIDPNGTATLPNDRIDRDMQRCQTGMGEEDRGGLPDLDPNLSKNWGGLPDPNPDLSKNQGGLPDLDFDPTRPDFCRHIIPLKISCPYLIHTKF